MDGAAGPTGTPGPLDAVDPGGVDGLAAMLDPDHPVKRAAASWATGSLAPLELPPDRATLRPVWERCADAGLQRCVVPAEHGGLGLDTVTAMLVFEGLGLGSGDDGLVFALASQVFAMQKALLSAADDAQRERWLPGLLDGSSFGAFAMTEPDAGSDTSAITTTAERVDGEGDTAVYELSGEKCWITLGPVADVVVAFATTDPSLGRWGTTAFAVDTALDGVTCHAPTPKLGLSSSPFGSITFDRVRLTAAERLGPEGAGAGIFTKAVEGERALLFAGRLGATEALLDRCIDRARTRRQFGAPIGSNQAVAHRLADLAVAHETARLLVYKAAALADAGRPVGTASAMAKLAATESAVATALAAIELHGAEGYTEAAGLGGSLGDALGGLAYSGTADIQRMIIARTLGVARPVRPGRTPPTKDPS